MNLRRHPFDHRQKKQRTIAQRSTPVFFIISFLHIFALSTSPGLATQASEFTQKTETATAEPAGAALSHTYTHIAQQAKPSVVTITVKKKMTGNPGYQTRPLFLDTPFFRRLFGQSSRPDEDMALPDSREEEVTSGVIIRPDGYILTNQHVMEQAYDIRVQLTDGRVFEAALIGQDRPTDVAILKIPASEVTPIQWGDSDGLQVGEMVITVSNPFGFSQTVTQGLISAVGRGNVGFVDIESFIQTDAAMNPGNSGGALLNLKGELIGINTAILPENSGALGIGFAIPSQMAKTVSSLLIAKGKVLRGWMGIATQKLTPHLAKHFQASNAQGVVITDVAKNGPASVATLQRRDIILTYQGTPITTPRQLQTLIAETIPGSSITIQRLQAGQVHSTTVKIEDVPLEANPATRKEPEEKAPVLKGVTVEPLPKDFPFGKEGVLVVAIAPGSLGDKRGLVEGDIIVDINQTPIHSVKDFERIANQIGKQDTALLLLRRENATMFLSLHKER